MKTSEYPATLPFTSAISTFPVLDRMFFLAHLAKLSGEFGRRVQKGLARGFSRATKFA